MFDVQHRAAAGRIGRFRSAHGDVTTPSLMPVVNPNIDLVTPKEMKERFGAEMVITNSYVIHKHDVLRRTALEHGVHDLIGFDGTVMTDSGTFQMYVYGDVDVSPEDIVRFQAEMGVDVATCLDLFVTPDMSRHEAQQAVQETLRRTRISADVLQHHIDAVAAGDKSKPSHEGTVLNTTVQGGVFTDLRGACADAYRDIPAGYTTIGGVVPMLEQQMYPELAETILHSQAHLRRDRPVHLFGAGHPLIFPLATALGCDLFDSSSYAKYAKDGRIMTPEATLHVQEVTEWPFSSRYLDGWNPAEMANALKQKPRRKQDAMPDSIDAVLARTAEAQPRIGQRENDDPAYAAQRAIALHNLDVCFTDLRRIRESIRHGTLWELVEQRAAAHPLLAAATRRLGEPAFQAWLEAREPLSGHKALRYTGSLTHRRPVFARIAARLATRYTPLGEKVPSEIETPYAKAGEEKREVAMHKEPRSKPFGANIAGPLDPDQDHVIISSIGTVPLGLDEAYPFAQSVLPRLEGLDEGHMGWVGQVKDNLLAAHDLMPGIPGPGLPGDDVDRDRLQVLRTADWQFGLGSGVVLAGLAAPDEVAAALREVSVGSGLPVDQPGSGPSAKSANGHSIDQSANGNSIDQSANGNSIDQSASGHSIDQSASGPSIDQPTSESAADQPASDPAARSTNDQGTEVMGQIAHDPHVPSGRTRVFGAAQPEDPVMLARRHADAVTATVGASQSLRCERSRATGKMRTVHLGDEHVLSLRAGDGLFTLKPAGARLLHAALPSPAMRVVVHIDSVPFNRDGKSVFAQFVMAADPALRPGDECLVVDAEDSLVAVGQLMMAPDEIGDWDHGMAVKVRDGIKAPATD